MIAQYYEQNISGHLKMKSCFSCKPVKPFVVRIYLEVFCFSFFLLFCCVRSKLRLFDKLGSLLNKKMIKTCPNPELIGPNPQWSESRE